MNETRRKKLNAKPARALWSIELRTHCPACDAYFDALQEHQDFVAEQGGVRSGVTHMECPECGNEFQIEMEF